MKLRTHQELALAATSTQTKGIICFSTGGGKTLVGIQDAFRSIENSTTPQTICVVAPRISLACQLCQDYLDHIDNVQVLHVHSGKVSHYSTTSAKNIKEWSEIHKDKHKLIFCVYNSLRKVQDSGIPVNTYVMDEAHNSIKASFFPHVKNAVEKSDRCYFYTATIKYTNTYTKRPGMNDSEVYGNVISVASAKDLVKKGYILKPRIVTHEVPNTSSENIPLRDCENLIHLIDNYDVKKVMVSVKNTKNMMALLTETDFEKQLNDRGYSLLHITSLHGAVVDGKKVKRDYFLRKLNEWGKQDDKKFIVLNYSILGEGVNISCLDAVYFMRSMNLVDLLQNTGRTLRIHPEDQRRLDSGELFPHELDKFLKPEGLVFCPVYDKSTTVNYQNIQTTIDNVFDKGEIPIAEIKK